MTGAELPALVPLITAAGAAAGGAASISQATKAPPGRGLSNLTNPTQGIPNDPMRLPNVQTFIPASPSFPIPQTGGNYDQNLLHILSVLGGR
jgi:hypothetical protein